MGENRERKGETANIASGQVSRRGHSLKDVRGTLLFLQNAAMEITSHSGRTGNATASV